MNLKKDLKKIKYLLYPTKFALIPIFQSSLLFV